MGGDARLPLWCGFLAAADKGSRKGWWERWLMVAFLGSVPISRRSVPPPRMWGSTASVSQTTRRNAEQRDSLQLAAAIGWLRLFS